MENPLNRPEARLEDRPEMNKRVTEEEMLASLDRVFAGDEEQSLARRIRRKFEDPLQPAGEANGKRRLHPLLVLLAFFILIALGAFIWFGVTQPLE